MAVRAGHAGRRIAVIGATVAVALGTVSAVLTKPVLASPRATQSAGWAPVPYENAQLSVPGSWLVESAQQQWCPFSPSPGMIFAGIRPGLQKGQGCRLTASLAWIVPAGHIGSELGHRRPSAVIHGFAVYRVHSGKGSEQFLVPGLKVLIGARGPLARRVLATLHRSPLSVVLRSGTAGTVLAGWTWRRFGGVRFAAPRSWSLQRADRWATCARPDCSHGPVRGRVGRSALRPLRGTPRRPNLPGFGHGPGRSARQRADLLSLPTASPRSHVLPARPVRNGLPRAGRFRLDRRRRYLPSCMTSLPTSPGPENRTVG
jgi:hypothetical protein